jgi:predicted small metal-binding protein
MTKKVTCKELGIKDCGFSASAEAAGDVVREMVEHLRVEHDIDMPDANVILAGEVKEESLERVDPEVELVVERLTKALNLVPAVEPELKIPTAPPGGPPINPP